MTPPHLQPLGMITLNYAGYDATHAFEHPEITSVEAINMSRTAPLHLPTAPLDSYECAEWIRDNELEIISATRAGTAKRASDRRWYGRYNLIIGASRDTLDWITGRMQ